MTLPTPSRRGTLALRDALADSEPLARLQQRLAEARRRFDAAASVVPPALHGAMRAGPVHDDGSWTLLADHNAAAAKLRHLLPEIDAALRAAGCAPGRVAVRVQPRGSDVAADRRST